jgi:hypothetical protein
MCIQIHSGGRYIKKTGIPLVMLLLVLIFVLGCAGNTQGKAESSAPVKQGSQIYLKFETQIFTFLALSLFLAFTWSVYVSAGKREERKNAIEMTEHRLSSTAENHITPWNPEPSEPVFDPAVSMSTIKLRMDKN